MIKKYSKPLSDIWHQVPPDYYQQSIESNWLQKIWHQQKINNLSQLLKNSHYQKILDLGCAGGWMTNQIKLLFPQSQIYGVDSYEGAIITAKKLYPDIIFKCSDAHKLSFPDKSFHLIICYETIEHVAQPEVILREMRRVLKKNGKIIIAMDSGNVLFKLIWFLWERTKGRVWQGAHLHPFKHKELEKLIIKEELKIRRKHFTHMGLEVVFEVTK